MWQYIHRDMCTYKCNSVGVTYIYIYICIYICIYRMDTYYANKKWCQSGSIEAYRAEPCCMYIAIYCVQKNGGKVPQPRRPQLRHFVPGHHKDIYIYMFVLYLYIYVCIYIYILFIYLSIYTISISTSLCLYVCMFTPFSKELPFSVPDGRSGVWTHGGGGTGSRWKIISNQGGPKPVRHEKSCELYPVSRQYIAKANPTPASKLAFVIMHKGPPSLPSWFHSKILGYLESVWIRLPTRTSDEI